MSTVSDNLNPFMFLMRDSKPGDLVMRRRQVLGDTFLDFVLRPAPDSVISFDDSLLPKVETKGAIAGYQAIVEVPNDATRLILDQTYLRNGSRVFVTDTGKYWDVVKASVLPGAEAFIEVAVAGGGGGSPANTVFVETNGSDTTGDGSQSKPWATLQKAVGTVGGTKLIQMGVGSFYASNVGSAPLYLRGVGQSKTKVQIYGLSGQDGQFSTGVFHCNLIDAAAALTEGLTGGDPDTTHQIGLQTNLGAIPLYGNPWFTVTTDSSGNVSLAGLRAALIAVGDYTLNFDDSVATINDYDAPYALGNSANFFNDPLPFTGGLDGLNSQVTGRITVTKTIRNRDGTVGGDVTLYASSLFFEQVWSGNGGGAQGGSGGDGGTSGSLSIFADGSVMVYLATVGNPGNGISGYGQNGNLTLENVKAYQALGHDVSLKCCSVFSLAADGTLSDFCTNGSPADTDAGSGHGSSGGAPSTNSFGLIFNLMD